MRRESELEVLVVGAGPVGMLTALELAAQGVLTGIIDKEECAATHSCACLLHPRTLRLLAEMGLADEVVRNGRRIESVSFYEGISRGADLNFGDLGGEFPFLLAVSQSDLEAILEDRLRERGLKVQWEHRLAGLEFEGEKVHATIDKLGDTGKGYAVPSMQRSVDKTVLTHARFVVGADGRDSHLRQMLEIGEQRVIPTECFAICEFETEEKFAEEVRVILDDRNTSMFIPLPDNRCRWTLQISRADVPTEAHLKDRTHIRLLDPDSDQDALRQMRELWRERAPWFETPVDELEWHTTVDFGGWVARRFGRDRCWLAGDAAHLSSPIGMQSMNVGLCEAAELGHLLASIIKNNGSAELLATYNADCRKEWLQLLGIDHAVASSHGASPWARRFSERILPCIPASGEDLGPLLGQIGLQFAPAVREGMRPVATSAA